jgi:hypothetical protein
MGGQAFAVCSFFVHHSGGSLLISISSHVVDVLNADAEVNWEKVRILPDGETVSLAGTHLGHNLVSQCDSLVRRTLNKCMRLTQSIHSLSL